jgi:peptide/nickel transport system permease protein
MIDLEQDLGARAGAAGPESVSVPPAVEPAARLPGAGSIRSEAAWLDLPASAVGAEATLSAPVLPSGVKPLAVAASALLPGAGHLIYGRIVSGLSFLFFWGVGLALLFHVREDLAATFHGGAALDRWIAACALLVYLAAVWGKAMVDVTVRLSRPPRLAGISQWAIAGRRFRKNRLAMIGLVIMGFIYLVTLMGPYLAPYDPNAQEDIVRTRYLAPSAEHPMGTDKFGRDILSRVIYGARISLSIGFIAVAISVTLGTLVGAVAGYFGGWVDNVAMRLVDLLISFPRLVLLLAVIALFQPSIFLIIAVLGVTGWMGTSRIVRGQFLSLREQEFVQATEALGYGSGRIIFRHILPNAMAPIIVVATLGIGNTILTEAALSFLGLGVQPPTASWGSMVSDGKDALINAWWIATFPGLAIVLTVVCFNLLGDAARDALDPRLRS